MSIVCGLEVYSMVGSTVELHSLLGWHHTKDVTQLLDRLSTDERRVAIGCRGDRWASQDHTTSRHKQGMRAGALAQIFFCEHQLILDPCQFDTKRTYAAATHTK